MSAELRVMSFNIRYGTAEDAANHWSTRRELVVQAIRRFGPDLLGVQEAVECQVQYLRDGLSEYACVSAGRDDGQKQGEHVPLFFRSQRFEATRSGHFWLSETPAVAGSKSWDSRLPRMVTWCQLRDSVAPAGPLYFFNTHFDMRGERSRSESAKLLRERIAELGADCRLVITGDFNCSEDEMPHRILMSGSAEAAKPADLIDSYRAAYPRRGDDESTRHDFSVRRHGPRIDWILHSRRFATVEADIDRRQVDGRFASDHHPVTAVLQSV